MTGGVPWRLQGSYAESCNCDAICPCRSIGGRPGTRSTHGICLFALSWLVQDGRAGDVDLGGLAVVLTGRYDDDEPGSPWTFVLHVDDRGEEAQRDALEAIFLGRLGGERVSNLPWVRKPSELLAVKPSRIEIDHTPRRQWFRVRDEVTVRISRPALADETVTCAIPGHDRIGEELIAEVLHVDEAPLHFEFSGTCGYASDFAYSSY